MKKYKEPKGQTIPTCQYTIEEIEERFERAKKSLDDPSKWTLQEQIKRKNDPDRGISGEELLERLKPRIKRLFEQELFK